ncbi:ORF1142 [White spot syndrome virus]|uniref:ORF1142 n=1 Tax=White spot syndrome virus TaxID=342409 RepID=A0A2D3I6J6_9VIRU|nr:ORF1142 [White spot syndrome virus]
MFSFCSHLNFFPFKNIGCCTFVRCLLLRRLEFSSSFTKPDYFFCHCLCYLWSIFLLPFLQSFLCQILPKFF